MIGGLVSLIPKIGYSKNKTRIFYATKAITFKDTIYDLAKKYDFCLTRVILSKNKSKVWLSWDLAGRTKELFIPLDYNICDLEQFFKTAKFDQNILVTHVICPDGKQNLVASELPIFIQKDEPIKCRLIYTIN